MVDERRQLIEVLLCGAKSGCVTAALYLGAERAVAIKATRLRARAQRTSPLPNSFETLGIEAAYRLIESSPTLRREWFGAP